jgi:hypothetical protein
VPAGQFKQRDAFLDRSAGDGEEVASVGLREASIPLGEVGRDRQGRAVDLVSEEAEAARGVLRAGNDAIGEIDGASVDVEVLEHEGHRRVPGRAGEQ